MSLCEDCVKGVRHEGEPEGKWEEIGGVNCYVSTPTGTFDSTKVILILPDIYGPHFINNQLFSDGFAQNNFKTIIPDYFNGDPVAADAIGPNRTFNLQDWFAKHGAEQTRPPLDNVINALKAAGVTKFAAVGVCFGARYVFDIAFEGLWIAAVVNHPSLLKNPDDLEHYVNASKTPLLINSCEVDPQFPADFQAKADEVFKGFAPGYKREYWAGCTHGFSVRGDMSNDLIRAGKEGAFKAAVQWFQGKL